MSRKGLSSTIVPLRSDRELEEIAAVGAVLARILDLGLEACRPGVRTIEIDEVIRESIRGFGAESLFDGYAPGVATPFPGVACISVHEQVVHGVPGERVIRVGDLVSVDVGIRMEGWCADAARTILVADEDGQDGADGASRRLIETTEGLLESCIGMIRPGRKWSEVGLALERMADQSGFGMVTEYVGHGIGRELHEPPKVPAYANGFTGADFTLAEGMVLAIEPILTLGRGPVGEEGSVYGVPGRGLPRWRMPVRLLDDGWTVVTEDGSAACHIEWMVGVTGVGGMVLGR